MGAPTRSGFPTGRCTVPSSGARVRKVTMALALTGRFAVIRFPWRFTILPIWQPHLLLTAAAFPMKAQKANIYRCNARRNRSIVSKKIRHVSPGLPGCNLTRSSSPCISEHFRSDLKQPDYSRGPLYRWQLPDSTAAPFRPMRSSRSETAHAQSVRSVNAERCRVAPSNGEGLPVWMTSVWPYPELSGILSSQVLAVSGRPNTKV
jgi:hypothetical protein